MARFPVGWILWLSEFRPGRRSEQGLSRIEEAGGESSRFAQRQSLHREATEDSIVNKRKFVIL